MILESILGGEVVEANRTVVRNITPGHDVVNCRRLRSGRLVTVTLAQYNLSQWMRTRTVGRGVIKSRWISDFERFEPCKLFERGLGQLAEEGWPVGRGCPTGAQWPTPRLRVANSPRVRSSIRGPSSSPGRGLAFQMTRRFPAAAGQLRPVPNGRRQL